MCVEADALLRVEPFIIARRYSYQAACGVIKGGDA